MHRLSPPRLVSLVAVLCLAAASGCGGNACDSYRDAYVAKASECGLTITAEDHSPECEAEQAALAEKLEACVKTANCEQFLSATFARDCLTP